MKMLNHVKKLFNKFIREGKIKKRIVIEVGAIIFAAQYSAFFSLWHSKGVFHAFTPTYWSTLCFTFLPFVIFLFLYLKLDKNFNNTISLFWTLYFMIGFMLIMPVINAMLLFTPVNKLWGDDLAYLYRYSIFWTSVGVFYFLILIFMLKLKRK